MSLSRILDTKRQALRGVGPFSYPPIDMELIKARREAMEREEEEGGPILEEILGPETPENRTASVERQILQRLQQTEREAHDIARKAYEEGFAAGEAEGRSLGEGQYQLAMQRLDSHLDEISETTGRIREALENELIALALTIGEYLAAQKLETTPQSIHHIIEQVLEELPFPLPSSRRRVDGGVLLYLHPKDYATLEASGKEYPGVRLMEDPGLSRGSLRLDAPQGVLESTVERRRDHIMEVLERFREQDTQLTGYLQGQPSEIIEPGKAPDA